MTTVSYRNVMVDGVHVFYREAGEQHAQTLVLLHGFPSSSHMFRNLIPTLAENFHVVAPDYPGYGYSDCPSREQFAYTFDHLEAEAFKQDLSDCEVHLLDTGHFALEEDGDVIAEHIKRFLTTKVPA